MLSEKRHCISVGNFISHPDSLNSPLGEPKKLKEVPPVGDDNTVALLWMSKGKLKRVKSTMRKHGILPEARGLLWQSLVYRQLVVQQLAPHPVPTTAESLDSSQAIHSRMDSFPLF